MRLSSEGLGTLQHLNNAIRSLHCKKVSVHHASCSLQRTAVWMIWRLHDALPVHVRDRIHLKGEKVEVKPKGGGKPKDLSKKALMLSGPPGIGKTSSAMIVAR